MIILWSFSVKVTYTWIKFYHYVIHTKWCVKQKWNHFINNRKQNWKRYAWKICSYATISYSLCMKYMLIRNHFKQCIQTVYATFYCQIIGFTSCFTWNVQNVLINECLFYLISLELIWSSVDKELKIKLRT